MRKIYFSPVSKDNGQLTQVFAALTLALPGKALNVEMTRKSLLLNKVIARLDPETEALGGRPGESSGPSAAAGGKGIASF